MTSSPSQPPPGAHNGLFCCPVHRDPLDDSDGSRLVGLRHGEIYPIVNGIPILLPDSADRERIAQTDWDAPEATTSNVDFYNRSAGLDDYFRPAGPGAADLLKDYLRQCRISGPTLEIGSGKGGFQGLSARDDAGRGQYIALDYSFTALRRFIDPSHPRVCATAERLPFPDASIAFIFTIDALEHVPNADLAFAEIDRVLKPGGITYLHPAWHCTQYNCEGIPVRPCSQLTLRQKFVKLSLPPRRHPLAKALGALPGRSLRRALWALGGRRPSRFRFHRLRADYQHFWAADADACSRLDSHEGCLYFASRRYEVLNPGATTISQLLCRHVPIVVRKPPAA
jgi:SAM-dependent methyltransferase